MIYALWHGGSSYFEGHVDDDTEEFATLEAASAEFRSRPNDPYYPDVHRIPAEDGGPSMMIYRADPRGQRDPYPDHIIEFGPRGGVWVTQA